MQLPQRHTASVTRFVEAGLPFIPRCLVSSLNHTKAIACDEPSLCWRLTKQEAYKWPNKWNPKDFVLLPEALGASGLGFGPWMGFFRRNRLAISESGPPFLSRLLGFPISRIAILGWNPLSL
jgi:hypothetical protein